MSLASKRKENLNFPGIFQTVLPKQDFSLLPLWHPTPIAPPRKGGIWDILVLLRGPLQNTGVFNLVT